MSDQTPDRIEAAPDKSHPAYRPVIQYGKSLGEIPSLRSYQMFITNFWNSKDYLKLYYMSECILIDQRGYLCLCGKDMDEAEYPVKIYKARPES